MFLEQFEYEIRHLSGSQNEISDGLSRLHLRNLMLTAPTNAEAEAERRQGIIAPSTHVVGVPPVAEPLKNDEDKDEDDTNGEGGLDEALFNAMQGGPTGKFFEIEPSTEVSRKAAEAEWQELEEDEPEGDQETEEHMKMKELYGKGYKLMQKAGGGKQEARSTELWDMRGARTSRFDRRGLGAGEEVNRYARLNRRRSRGHPQSNQASP